MRVKEANQTRLGSMQLRLPTLRLLRRLLKRIPEFDKYAARYGSEAARRVFRSSKGKIFAESPLDRAEIDHTQLDGLVSRFYENMQPANREYPPWASDRFLYLCWKGASHEWMLAEDNVTTKENKADEASVTK